MVQIKMKLKGISKNVISFVADEKDLEVSNLTPSGRNSFGQAEFVVSDKEVLKSFEENPNKDYIFTIEEDEGDDSVVVVNEKEV